MRGAHVAPDFLHQVQRPGNVGVDDMAHRYEILVQEPVAQTATGVGEKNRDGPAADGGIQFVDPFDG